MNTELLLLLIVAYLEQQDASSCANLNEWLSRNGLDTLEKLSPPRAGQIPFLDLLQFLPTLCCDELAGDFAEHILPLGETEHPNELRPRMAIEARGRWIRAVGTWDEWQAAWKDASQLVAECLPCVGRTEQKKLLGEIAWTCCGGSPLTRGADSAAITAWSACFRVVHSAGWQQRPDLSEPELLEWMANYRQQEIDWQRQRVIERLRGLLPPST